MGTASCVSPPVFGGNQRFSCRDANEVDEWCVSPQENESKKTSVDFKQIWKTVNLSSEFLFKGRMGLSLLCDHVFLMDFRSIGLHYYLFIHFFFSSLY